MKNTKIIKRILLMTVLATPIYASIQVEQFCFKDNTVDEKKVVESNLVTLEGFNEEKTLKIKGRGGYMLNGVYMGREESRVKNGDQIRLIQESMDEDGAKVSTVLIVGDTYDTFTTVTNQKGMAQNKYEIASSPCQR